MKIVISGSREMRTQCALGVLGILVAGMPTRAQDAGQPVVLHGFGSWAYGRTSNNIYLAGNPDGDFRRTSMALNLVAHVADNLSIRTQGEVQEDESGTHTVLNYGFAEYVVSDHLTFRVGQVKHPFGIYTEVFSVGTLRPFLSLPQGFYGPVGFAGQSYKGLGVSGTAESGRWEMSYDAYAGGADLEKFAPPEAFYRGDAVGDVSGANELESTRNVVGGRLVVHTPITGFSVGASSYTGILNEPASNRRTVFAGQIDYRSDRLTIEAEGAHENQVGDESAIGGYVQAAYRLSPEWQVAAQGDYLINRFFGVSHDSVPSLQRHDEVAFALNYWLTRALVIKTEYHRVHGNRFAVPSAETLIDAVNTNRLRATTHLFQFGGQFSF
jgi:hypothetical protein